MQQYTIAMIGAGPASLYAAEVLAKAGHQVVILNRDIKPGGLAEFGIYPTKYKMKGGLRRYFERVLKHENIEYFGNITIGEEADFSLEELREMGFDATVVAVGAQGTKWLGLEGEQARSVYHAKDLVYHYNGLPPFSEREFPIGRDVVVVGLGNVALDIVHWMICERQVNTVTTVARRGPAERKFTRKEYRLVCGALDAEDLELEFERIGSGMREVGQDPEAELQELLRFVDSPLEKESQTKFRMRFLMSPSRVEVDEEGNVVGLVCEKTHLLGDDGSGRMRIEGRGEFETIPCDTVVFAIGDSIEPSLGLPWAEGGEQQFATVPDAWEAYPERPRYMVFDPAAGEPMWDTFVVGWARKASDGLVGKARADAVQGTDEILAFLNGEFPVGPAGEKSSEEILGALGEAMAARELRPVKFEEVQRLSKMEAEEAKRRGLEEFKIGSRAEILERLALAESAEG